MSADLAEEHTTATLATERMENEQAERLKLEKEKSELLERNSRLTSANERMEMDLMYSTMNGEFNLDADLSNADIVRQKYERVARELDMTKKRLAQQHEDDMEQLMAMKKQLEKKVKHDFI